jgi:Dockerin type I domain
MTTSITNYSKADFTTRMPNILLSLLLVCGLALPFKATGTCLGPEVVINAKTLALTSSVTTKLIYRDIFNRITDSCDGDLTFVNSKVLMERVLSTDPTTPTAPRTLTPNGTSTGLIGNAGLIDSSGNPTTDGLTFSCADMGRQFVRVWARNNAGNWRFAIATVTIQDNDGVCETDRFMFFGVVSTENNSPVKDVVISASVNDTVWGSGMTSSNGTYSIINPRYDTIIYKIRANKIIDTDRRNGVTTLDIALISKHLLGVQTLNSPYKIIAADVNKDGEVDGIDMLAMRRFVLGITQTFPAATFWRFIDRNYIFSDPTRPFDENFHEFINFMRKIRPSTINFMAVKLGDVNYSFDATLVRGSKTLTLNAPDMDLVAGNEYTVAIRADNLDAVGFQGTFAFEGATVKTINAGNLNNLSEANFGKFNKAVTASWNGQSAAAAEVVNITFLATKSGKLSDILTLNSAVTMSEAYDAAGNAMSIRLLFDTGKSTDKAFALYQNTPNPVEMSTKIGFDLPKDGEATLTVYTAEGKTLRLINNHYKAGYNEVIINK